MADYDVVIDKIRQTGKAAQRVAGGVRGVQSSAAVPTGNAGMPGARSLRCIRRGSTVRTPLRPGWCSTLPA
jgi:hypothetical protein